jgi:hypothetical protein
MKMKKHDTQIILLHETVGQAIVKDFVTTLSAFVLIGLGVLVGSTVMQVFGAIATVLLVLGKAAGYMKQTPILTPQQAADKLKREFGVVAK